MNKSETNIRELLNKNNAIFNYIYDNRGFRIGVVVAQKGKLKGHNAIGWALFQELPSVESSLFVNITSTPIYKEMEKALKESLSSALDLNCSKDTEVLDKIKFFDMCKSLESFLKGVQSIDIPSEDDNVLFSAKYDVTKKDIMDTIKLALSKVNYDSWNYYSPLNKGHDLREGIINLSKVEDKESLVLMGTKMPILTNSLRKAIKKMEYRAWRYFK